MPQFYFSVNLDDDRMLCLAPLTDRRIQLSGQEIENTAGYFLYEQRKSDHSAVKIIAHVLSDEAAFDLRDMFKMA